MIVECDSEKDARRSLDARAVIHSSNESSNLLIAVMRVVISSPATHSNKEHHERDE